MGSFLMPSWGSSKSAPKVLVIRWTPPPPLPHLLPPPSQSDLSHTQIHSPPTQKNRPTHILTRPHSDSLTIRSIRNQFIHTQTQAQAHPHSDSLRPLALRDTLTLSLFTLRSMHSGHPKGSRQGVFILTARSFTPRLTQHQAHSYPG